MVRPARRAGRSQTAAAPGPRFRRPRSSAHPSPGRGAIAQLGERLNGIQEVVGSIPSGSTKNSPDDHLVRSRSAAASAKRNTGQRPGVARRFPREPSQRENSRRHQRSGPGGLARARLQNLQTDVAAATQAPCNSDVRYLLISSRAGALVRWHNIHFLNELLPFITTANCFVLAQALISHPFSVTMTAKNSTSGMRFTSLPIFWASSQGLLQSMELQSL